MKLSKNQSGFGGGLGMVLGPQRFDGEKHWGAKRDVWLVSYFSKLDQHT